MKDDDAAAVQGFLASYSGFRGRRAISDVPKKRVKTGTGLLVRSFQNLLNVDIGVDRDHLLSVVLDARLARGRSDALTSDELTALQQRVLDSVAAVPGVSSASLAMCGFSGCERVVLRLRPIRLL